VLLSIESRPEMTGRLAFLDSKKHLRAQIPGALFLATSYSLLYHNTKTSTYKLQLQLPQTWAKNGDTALPRQPKGDRAGDQVPARCEAGVLVQGRHAYVSQHVFVQFDLVVSKCPLRTRAIFAVASSAAIFTPAGQQFRGYS
jgi:hypothetical protein